MECVVATLMPLCFHGILPNILVGSNVLGIHRLPGTPCWFFDSSTLTYQGQTPILQALQALQAKAVKENSAYGEMM